MGDISSDDEDDLEIDFKYVSDEVDNYTGKVSEEVLERLKEFRDTLYLLTAEEGTFGPVNNMKGTNAGNGRIPMLVNYMKRQEKIIIDFKKAAIEKGMKEAAAVKAAMTKYECLNNYKGGFNILDNDAKMIDKLIKIVGIDLAIPQILYMFRISRSIDIDEVFVYADALVKKYSPNESDFPIYKDPPAAGNSAAGNSAAAASAAATSAAGAKRKRSYKSIRTQEREAYNSKMAKFHRGWQRLESAIQRGHVNVTVRDGSFSNVWQRRGTYNDSMSDTESPRQKKPKIGLHSDLSFRLRF